MARDLAPPKPGQEPVTSPQGASRETTAPVPTQQRFAYGGVSIDLSTIRPELMLHIQRAAGNRAAVQLLDRGRDMKSPPTVQRMPTHEQFLEGAKQDCDLNEVAFTSKYAEKALGVKRGKKLGSAFGDKANINVAYQAYDRDRTISALTDLYDTITYWEALSNANAEEDWVASAMGYLAEIKQEIRREVGEVTRKDYSESELHNARKEKQRAERRIDPRRMPVDRSDRRPGWMKVVGISRGYFEQHLESHPERVESLHSVNESLRAGKLKEAGEAYREISSVPGMYMIKSLLLQYWADEAGLGSLVTAKAKGIEEGVEEAPEEITKPEREAIKLYSGGGYVTMNAQLRTTLSPTGTSPGAEGSPEQRPLMDLVVSGLNKLPPYQGLAYRGLLTEPGDYFDVVQPGATIVDMAFQSASPSLKGVETYMSSQAGSKHIYCLIHSRTAVNIMAFAGGVTEAEILFRPGIKFKVNAIWQHTKNGHVPPLAPAEAQMILHRSGTQRTSGLKGKWSTEGMSIEVAQERFAPAEIESMKWHTVKVIEMEEI